MKLTRHHVVLASFCAVAVCLFACGAPHAQRSNSPAAAEILLFAGDGTSPGDVAAVERILQDSRYSYATADSLQLNAMTETQLRAYRLLIVPGGNFEQIGDGLTAITAENIRDAIRGGTNYLGLCAGAFFAGASPYNGLNLTDGVRFDFYALEAEGIRRSAVPISVAGGSTGDQYWEDGPQLSGWGAVVAKYPDGAPAIVEGAVGDGWVILTGIHPEAPESWRRGMVFSTSVSENNTYAVLLIDAALTGAKLEHY